MFHHVAVQLRSSVSLPYMAMSSISHTLIRTRFLIHTFVARCLCFSIHVSCARAVSRSLCSRCVCMRATRAGVGASLACTRASEGQRRSGILERYFPEGTERGHSGPLLAPRSSLPKRYYPEGTKRGSAFKLECSLWVSRIEIYRYSPLLLCRNQSTPSPRSLPLNILVLVLVSVPLPRRRSGGRSGTRLATDGC